MRRQRQRDSSPHRYGRASPLVATVLIATVYSVLLVTLCNVRCCHSFPTTTTTLARPIAVLARIKSQWRLTSRITTTSDDEVSENNKGQSQRVNGGDQDSCPSQDDSVKEFEKDVANLLNDLRPYQYDPTVPKWFRRRQLSFTNYWGLEEWQKHSSRRRHLRYVFTFPKSRLLHRSLPQLCVLLVWSLIAIVITRRRPMTAGHVRVPLTSLSLVSTFVAALQTLRSNQGLSRLKDARYAMGRMVLFTRDIAMLFACYVFPHDAQLGLKGVRLLALFGWSLKSHLRDTGGDDIVHCLMRGEHTTDTKYICRQRKKPIAILHRLRQITEHMYSRGLLGSTEHKQIEGGLRQLNSVVTEGERIRASPIPPIYAAHAGRLMIVYLVSLPFALLGADLSALSTIGLTMTVGFAMLGLDEMSHLFEQPFRFMPLYQLAKVSTMDVADTLCQSPPPLDEKDDANSGDEIQSIPLYFAKAGQVPALPYDGREFDISR